MTPEARPTPPVPLFDQVYPPTLRDAEAAALRDRRKRNGIPADAPVVGMALSGGGIRSATFCLGLFQALAREGLIGRIDFLSTVSGGGYFGSFLGALFQRQQPPGAKSVEQTLADSHSWPVRWLRENGRYLSPNGAGDNVLAAAVLLRNWVAVHVVLITFVLMALASASLIRAVSWQVFAGNNGVPDYEAWFAQHPFLWIWWSPFVLLPATTFALGMVPLCSLYWLTQCDLLIQCATAVARRSANGVPPTEAEVASRLRDRCSRGLAVCFLATLVLLAFAFVDSVGQTIYTRWFLEGTDFPSLWAGVAAGGMAVFGVAQKLLPLFDKLPRRRSFKLPFDLVALVGSVLWVLVVIVGLSFVAHGLAWEWEMPALEATMAAPFRMEGGMSLLVTVLVTFGLSWWFSRDFGFVNLSSQQQFYAARLKRAYLGGANPARREAQNFDLTNPSKGDEIPMADYRPHEHGGPLHLINLTINETISGKSQIEQRDRKGLPLAVGACGLSVGTKDHALWDDRRENITPIHHLDGDPAHALLATDHPPAGTATAALAPPQPVEQLALGNWIALSGAAFTTGLGAGTSLGLSLLLGLANVRLGYWWDSHISPRQRVARPKPGVGGTTEAMIDQLLPVQSCLFDEFLARFSGPARRHWYLSDGGHFENTACYELIRRRVPFIIASDAGQDARYEFADLANLVRKARTDFKAEIEVLRRRADPQAALHGGPFPLPSLEEVVPASLLGAIGQPEDFRPVPGAVPDGETPGEPTAYASRHALLARVHYLDTHQFSYILFLKPSLTGDEPADILQYQKTQPDFPQESTMDQYFDEAQWESYRKLGELIASLIFAKHFEPGPLEVPGWAPCQMRPPTV